MTITTAIREQIRKQADYSCEFCGVTESDAGAELTLDHFHPKSKGGTDEPTNLIYCCSRCNQYKSDYWPDKENEIHLWNPRTETAIDFFITAEDGVLHPLNETGKFTINRLRLNRPALIKNRLNRAKKSDELQLLTRYSELIELIDQLNQQMSSLMIEQKSLLKEQRDLLRLLIRQKR